MRNAKIGIFCQIGLFGHVLINSILFVYFGFFITDRNQVFDVINAVDYPISLVYDNVHDHFMKHTWSLRSRSPESFKFFSYYVKISLFLGTLQWGLIGYAIDLLIGRLSPHKVIDNNPTLPQPFTPSPIISAFRQLRLYIALVVCVWIAILALYGWLKHIQ